MDRSEHDFARAEQVQWLCETMAGLLHTLRAQGVVSNEQIERTIESLNFRRQGVHPDTLPLFDNIENRLRAPAGL